MILSDKDPFGVKAWHEFLNQIDFLLEHGITIDAVREKLALRKLEYEENLKIELTRSSDFLCPECKAHLTLLPVNDSPATQTGDNSKSMWMCIGCFYEKFSDKTVNEELSSKY